MREYSGNVGIGPGFREVQDRLQFAANLDEQGRPQGRQGDLVKLDAPGSELLDRRPLGVPPEGRRKRSIT